MAHEVLWYAVTVVVAVLGLIVWRFNATQQKVNLPSAETLARRTVKKELNIGGPGIQSFILIFTICKSYKRLFY